MQKWIVAMFAYIRTIAFMLLLQMVMKGGGIAMRVGRCWLWLETTEMTHEVTCFISLVAYKLLLLRFRGYNHVGLP